MSTVIQRENKWLEKIKAGDERYEGIISVDGLPVYYTAGCQEELHSLSVIICSDGKPILQSEWDKTLPDSFDSEKCIIFKKGKSGYKLIIEDAKMGVYYFGFPKEEPRADNALIFFRCGGAGCIIAASRDSMLVQSASYLQIEEKDPITDVLRSLIHLKSGDTKEEVNNSGEQDEQVAD